MQALVDLPKGGLGSPLYAEEFVDKAKYWNENSPDIVNQQRVHSIVAQSQFIIIAI